MKKIIKSFACILLIVLCGVNKDADAFCGFGIVSTTPPTPTCSCTQNKVAIKRMSNAICEEEKCVSTGAATHYINQGWIYGCCAVARLDVNQQAGETLNVYPNPVSSSAVISFSLDREQKVSLRIFDVNGRIVLTLADRIFEAGENKVLCNTEQVEAGIYFLQMKTEAGIESMKLSVTK
jgi:hypothetical protein